jgi:uncharacterized cupin superfamily protein
VAKKITIADLNHEELRSARTGEAYSLSALLTLGLEDLFVHHEILPPGRRSSGRHAHTRREELIVVLDGRVRAWCGDAEVVLNPGDVMGFPPGRANAHYVENAGDGDASVLVIASTPGEDDVEYV